MYLDSSVIVASIFVGSPHSEAADEFLQHLIIHGSTVYFSELVRFEYAQAIRNLATRRNLLPAAQREQFNLDRWEGDLFVRTHWLSYADAKLNMLIDQFAGSYEGPFQRDLWNRILSLMAYYDLKSYDAVHLATAQHHGIAHFATCDRHFAAINGLSLFLVRDS